MKIEKVFVQQEIEEESKNSEENPSKFEFDIDLVEQVAPLCNICNV